MEIDAFDYFLPRELIAQQPAPNRDRSRLLWQDRSTGALQEGSFRDLSGLLRPGDLLVANDTKVVPARLTAYKPSGGKVEILLERIRSSREFWAQLRAHRSLSPGQILVVADQSLTIKKQEGRFYLLAMSAMESAENLFWNYGSVPLPPYIRRRPVAADLEDYQTVFAAVSGAVAAPTAGLHFTEDTLDELRRREIGWATVTLHVGAGTFLPVRERNLEVHQMHMEWINVSEETCERIRQTAKAGGRIVAVGTTVVRALETAARHGAIRAFSGDTDLFIKPGFRFSVVDALITNFHLPKSTLLVLVSAFAGHASVMAMYHYAVQNRFRFFSYGDAMLLYRKSISGDEV